MERDWFEYAKKLEGSVNTKINKNVNCEICESSGVKISTTKDTVRVPYGKDVVYDNIVHSCEVCEGNYSVTDDETIKALVKKASSDSVSSMVDFIKDSGYSYTTLERYLDLPPRTISRLKNSEDNSAMGITLLRLLRSNPWLIELAGKGYNTPDAEEIEGLRGKVKLYEQFIKNGVETNNIRIPDLIDPARKTIDELLKEDLKSLLKGTTQPDTKQKD